MIRQIPNLVTLLRLAFAPVIFEAIWSREYGRALAWLIGAAFTDVADGFLARRLNVVSRAGAYLDPMADKVLLSGTYFILGYDRAIPLWLTAIVFGRDLLMLLFITFAMLVLGERKFPPTVWGKASTAVQILTAFVVLLAGAMDLGPYEGLLKQSLIVLAAAATGWSGVDYLRIGIGMVRNRARQGESPN